MSKASSAWKPIATAPKDGTRIILWLGAPWNEMRVAQWYSPWEKWVEEFPADEYDDIYGIVSGLPTHWMLPNPPSKNSDNQKYGCYCDLMDGEEPDECVIDIGNINYCIYAEKGMNREDCEYWKPIK